LIGFYSIRYSSEIQHLVPLLCLHLELLALPQPPADAWNFLLFLNIQLFTQCWHMHLNTDWF
jgi:hypothetical protein